MEDNRIIELYYERSEEALTRSAEKYGGFCLSIAQRMLLNRQDSEECVNDTWLGAWRAIPPAKPISLSAFLGRITRNLAVDRVRRSTAEKRGSGEYTVALSELDECIPDRSRGVEETVEARELGRCLNQFLAALDAEDRKLFVSRYYYLVSVEQLAGEANCSPRRIKYRLEKLRFQLKNNLQKEGVGR